MATSKQGVSRRAFLAVAGISTVAGCDASAPDIPRTFQTPGPRDPAPTSTESPSPTGSSPALSPKPYLPTEEEIKARFADVSPRAWGMEMPGITSRLHTDSMALTFDACGGARGSGYDEALLDLLRHHQIAATLFLNQRWIKKNLSLARELAADPLFEIANHGAKHCPLSVTGRAAYGIAGTASPSEAWREVRDNHELMLHELGVTSRFFRSGTAHYDDVGVQIATLAGEAIAGFSINGDQGATASRAAVRAEVSKARAGDIILAHMNQPTGHTAQGFTDALPSLIEQGTRFTTLGAVL